MRSQRIGRGFESLYLHHAKSTPSGVLFAWWSLNGEYAAQQGFKFNKAKKCRRSHSRQRILTRDPASGKRQNPFISIGSTATSLGLLYNGVSGAVKKMIEVDILKKIITKARDRVFECSGYIDILKSGT